MNVFPRLTTINSMHPVNVFPRLAPNTYFPVLRHRLSLRFFARLAQVICFPALDIFGMFSITEQGFHVSHSALGKYCIRNGASSSAKIIALFAFSMIGQRL